MIGSLSSIPYYRLDWNAMNLSHTELPVTAPTVGSALRRRRIRGSVLLGFLISTPDHSGSPAPRGRPLPPSRAGSKRHTGIWMRASNRTQTSGGESGVQGQRVNVGKKRIGRILADSLLLPLVEVVSNSKVSARGLKNSDLHESLGAAGVSPPPIQNLFL